MLYLLDPDDPFQGFPDPADAEREPNGLLAVGGDLSPERLLDAYRHGIFPWYNEDQPILWWSPDPRTLLFPDQVHVARSLKKAIRRQVFELSFDVAFPQVMRACAGPRRDAAGTWIQPETHYAYGALFDMGHAHSVEVWSGTRLVGGLYGVSIGRAFFGESMFSTASDASKVALVALCRRLEDWDFAFIDCQVFNPHLARMGAVEVPRRDFMALLEDARRRPGPTRHEWYRPPLPFSLNGDDGDV